MWFKNLTVMQLSQEQVLDGEAFEQQLAQAAFTPCLSHELRTHGWVPPLGRRTEALVHAVSGCYLICLQQEEKVIPAGVLRELVQDQVMTVEEREQRRLRKREKEQLRDEILLDLMPRALTRKRLTHAYLDMQRAWLIVNGSGKPVLELLERLQKVSGVRAKPLKPARAPSAVLTRWLTEHSWPDDLTPADEVELRDAEGVVRCKGQDLESDEIAAHLHAGKQVVRLALNWSDRLQFVLCDDLSIRRLRFLDIVQEQLDTVDTETAEALIDAQFALMTGELRGFLPRLLGFFA